MIPTPHIGAKSQNEIAKTVLMPGDPLRAKFIAENFLQDITQYNSVRNMLGYTGTYKGTKISVQGSGMGMPSIGIYSYELYSFYGVENIIRVGTAGAIAPFLKIRDIVLAAGACTNSNFAVQYGLQGTFAPIATYRILEKAAAFAKEKGLDYSVGNVLSSDIFYNDDKTAIEGWHKMGVLAVEMEAAALYMNAARLGKGAMCIMTISDIIGGAETDAAEREQGFKDMMHLALETAVSI
ncbi:MAG: purine-nucleoside phosphorylase [Defluviitaleaceae bacterium]|nr:purine-nucleoside phosphorylase [Defluviitaleaceae bacterium]